MNANVPGTVTTTYAYNPLGNLICKSDLGSCNSGSPNLNYGAVVGTGGSARTLPHALASVVGTVHGVTNPGYAYDNNGNLTSGAGRSVTYTSFNMTAQISAPGKNGVAYQYDSEHMRVRETNLSPTNSVLGTTYYLHPDAANGLAYEVDKTSSGSVTLHKHYVNAGGQAIALVTLSGTTWTTKYLHRDNLGSTTAITDASGSVIERLGYDSWGKRRNANGTTDPNDTLVGQNTDRGYTNAEHIESLALINMNGRVYDPALGRFMGADPYVQDPTDLQNFNRYAYVDNNPLAYVDPTGFYLILSGTGDPAAACYNSWDGTSVEAHCNSYSSPSYLAPDISATDFTSNPQGGSNSSGGSGSAPQPAVPETRVVSQFTDKNGVVNQRLNGTPTVGHRLKGTDNLKFDMLNGPGMAYISEAGGGGMPQREKHQYRSKVPTACNADEAFDAVKGMSAPGAPSAMDGTRRLSLSPLLPSFLKGMVPDYFTHENPITQVVDSQSRALLNVAERGHVFYPGTVLTTVTSSGDASVVETIGVGTGDHPIFNNIVGAIYFGFRNSMIQIGCNTANGILIGY